MTKENVTFTIKHNIDPEQEDIKKLEELMEETLIFNDVAEEVTDSKSPKNDV